LFPQKVLQELNDELPAEYTRNKGQLELMKADLVLRSEFDPGNTDIFAQNISCQIILFNMAEDDDSYDKF
jgi:hypothetical protein